MLTSSDRVQDGMVWYKSGHFYSFYYKRYQNDPIPTIIMLNYVHGSHPKTGHVHQYIQAINLSYVSRNYRKKFVEEWIEIFNRNNGRVKLTWDLVSKKYPYLKFAVRRYLIKQNFIRYGKEIKNEDIEKEVISTWLRDYSMAAMKQLAIINDKARKLVTGSKTNVFAKSLSKYVYRYSGGRI